MMNQEQNTSQGWKDDSANLMRLLKVITKCPRCMDELDKTGGMQVTLTDENEEGIRKLAVKQGVVLSDNDVGQSL